MPILAPNGCCCFYGSVAKHNNNKSESLRFDSSLGNLMFPLPHCSLHDVSNGQHLFPFDNYAQNYSTKIMLQIILKVEKGSS